MRRSTICLYHSNVHKHFMNPQNIGSFPKHEKNVGRALVGKASCGDVIKLEVKIEKNVITESRFKTFGCAAAISSSSLLTEMIENKSIDEALKINNKHISKYLNLPPVKIHCSLLAEEALYEAILNYQENN